ncbi:hypothetical protein C4571_03050 [Candidatus Parcubacteria bacterium]|nr:MAG: hypothetical protein C4571_03050 [Candidatus Parcubacteria bacterium]
MPVTIIPKQQRLDRWDTLSDALREALVSEQNSHIIREICRAEHVGEEKIPVVARVAGYVLLGFLHPEDVTDQIKEALEIDSRIASAVANALNTKIFSPLRSEIDKIYAPATAPTVPFSFSPAMMAQEASGKEKTPAEERMEEILQKIQEFVPQDKEKEPIPLDDAPEKKKESSSQESPVISESKAPVLEPLLLHKEGGSLPISPTGFEFEVGAGTFEDVKKSSGASEGLARVDIGGEARLPPPAITRTEMSQPRVVHYAALKTPLEEENVPMQQAAPPEIRADQPRLPQTNSPRIVFPIGEKPEEAPTPTATKMTDMVEGEKQKTSFFDKLAFWKKEKQTPFEVPPKETNSSPKTERAPGIPGPSPSPISSQPDGGMIVDLRTLGETQKEGEETPPQP